MVLSNGHWIALEGLPIQYAKLKEKPVVNGTCDTDGDSLYDWYELDELKSVRNLYIKPFLTALNMKIDMLKIPDDAIKVYGYTSNPIKIDTDGDGLLDGKPIYVEYTNTDGNLETLEVAPKDYYPKEYTGDKNLWKTHIESMKTQTKLATEDSGEYYKPTKPYIDIDFSLKNWQFSIDTNLIESLNSLYASIESLGADFRYNAENIALHSYGFQWQVAGGYNNAYDIVFDIVCSMDKKKYTFEYENKEYVIWGWKGCYLSLGAGSEVGFYEEGVAPGLWTFSDFFDMSCSLYKITGDDSYKTLYNWYPQETEFWVTGFVPEEVGIKENELRQISSVQFPSEEMYEEFVERWNNNSEGLIFDDIERKVWLMW